MALAHARGRMATGGLTKAVNVASRDLPLAKVGDVRIGSLTKPCAVGAWRKCDCAVTNLALGLAT